MVLYHVSAKEINERSANYHKEESRSSENWITFEIAVILIWHFIHGVLCIVLVAASLIFLNIELEPQFDPDYLDQAT
jgi:hypothetical protein